jgi:hypothetical protein
MSSVEIYFLYMPKIKTEITVITVSGHTGTNFGDI